MQSWSGWAQSRRRLCAGTTVPRRDGLGHRLALAIALFATYAMSASPALGCPECRVGRVARAAVFGESFVSQLCLLVLPLLLVGALAAALYRIGMPTRPERR